MSQTLVDKAILTVPGFENVCKTLHQQVTMQGQSQSTLNNYIRRIANISLHFQRLPEHISDDELNEYLTSLAIDKNSPSRSSFKHMVYGLRYYFRHIGDNKRAINLPSLKKEATLPVILNRSELKELFRAPTLLKHRIVPLSEYMAHGLKKYLSVEHPHIWLFNGKEPDGRYSVSGLSWVMREALKKTEIKKKVNLHSLRHSYATHLLEEGLNIVTLKELLGHSDVSTTMIYLHVARCAVTQAHSPLDTLYKDIS